MLATDENQEQLSVTADTKEDCLERLIKLYGSKSNFEIVDRANTTQKYGPFGLFQKPAVKLFYVVNRGVKNSAAFESEAESQKLMKEDVLRKMTGGKSIAEIQISEINAKVNEIASAMQKIPRSSGEDKIESIGRIEDMLDDNEFTRDFILGISARLKKEFSLDDLNDFRKVERQVVDWIGESIEVARPKHSRPPRVVVIVGPTGVGKTTTIGKLAAQNVILHKKSPDVPAIRISMITIDKTRIGAEKQLQTFGEVLDLPVHKAENADDLKSIFDSIKGDNDVIYIDTSGYSPNDSENIAKLKSTLSVDGLHPDVYLALAASTKARDIKNIMQNYEPFGYSSVIVTKCDETTRLGNIISVLNEKRKAISYWTDGQVISRNIQRANIVDFLIRLSGFTVDRIHIEEKFGED
jgi:flagellar biosynthesis protein FlhF